MIIADSFAICNAILRILFVILRKICAGKAGFYRDLPFISAQYLKQKQQTIKWRHNYTFYQSKRGEIMTCLSFYSHSFQKISLPTPTKKGPVPNSISTDPKLPQY